MAIKVGGTTVIDNSRELKNIATVDSTTVSTLNTALNVDPTKGTLTKTFVENETAEITLSSNVTVGPVVSATKEVPQTGVSTKGNWDVNSTASNYDFHNTAANVTLTPSTVGYDLSALSYDNKFFNHAQAPNINDIAISSDGTKIYYVGNNNYIWQIPLSTAFDVSTGGTPVYFDQSGNDNDPKDVTFKPDGTEMYVTGDQGNRIIAFALSTAWDITTASSLGASRAFTVSNQMSSPVSTQFKSDGTKMYVMENTNIYEYSLSTAWNLSTASYTNNTFVISGQDSSNSGMFLKPDGTKMFVVGYGNDKVYQYNFGTAWDLSTLSYSNNSTAAFTSTTGSPVGIAFSADGAKLYVGDSATAKVHQFTTGTDALALGSGSFASTDVGKRIVGNGGDVVLTATSGTFDTTGGSAFTDSSTIAAGSWSMFGLKSAGDADGITMPSLSQGGTTFNSTAALESTTPSSVNSSYLTSVIDGCVSKNGVYLYTINQSSNATLNQFTMSVPYDLSTATHTNSYTTGMNGSNTIGIAINNDGTKFYITYTQNSTDYLMTHAFGTAYDATTLSGTNATPITLGQTSVGTTTNAGGKFSWSADGTKAYYMGYYQWGGNSTVGHTDPTGTPSITGVIYQYDVSTAFDWANSSVGSPTASVRVPHRGTDYGSFSVTSDGKWLLNHQYNQQYMYVYPLTTPYDISTQVVASEVRIDTQPRNSSSNTNQGGIGMDHVNGILFNTSYSKARVDANKYATNITFTQPTSQYHVGVTNSGGRIDSQYFTDINSMTAAESAGTGTAHYAVSTDGRTTWSVAKGTDGVRPIVRNNSGTWQYNNDGGTVNGYDISSPTFISDTGTVVSNASSDPTGIFFKPDGTMMYISNNSDNRINDFQLSTAWDVSTASSNSNHGGTLVTTSQDLSPTGIALKSDGTKAYMLGTQNYKLYQYSLTNAWDIYPYSYDSVSFNFGSQDTNVTDFFFKPDGTQLFLAGENNDRIFAYALSTAWDLSTMSYSNVSFDISSYETGVRGLTFSADGTKMFTVGPAYVRYWTLGTAWDISTASYSGNYDSSGQGTTHKGIAFKDDGTRLYTVIADAGNYNQGNQKVNQYTTGGIGYGTSVTWANGTVNDELYTLQQALGAQAFNRMDKTQLDAIPDANHFSTGSSLDLMIALRMDTAAATLPTSDGVTLNYDAAALNEGAVLGTDYDFFHPAANKVQIKSLAAQNLKVRVV